MVGFDAGATCICLLSVCARAKGLFQRAFAFTGNLGAVNVEPKEARALANDLLKETKTATMAELMQLNTEALKDAAQRLWKNFCAPTCDGALIPADVYQAFQEGKASGIEFIIGIPNHEGQVLRAFVGEENYRELIFAGVEDMQNYLDGPVNDAVQAYINARTASSDELEVKAEIFEQWVALCIYRTALKLAEGGNKVHVMYWDEKPLIENLGSGTIDAAAALLGNAEAAQLYGSVVNNDLSEVLQNLIDKFITGRPLQLYSNEIKGVDEFDWEAFPKALVVSDKEFRCETVEDRLTRVKELRDCMVN